MTATILRVSGHLFCLPLQDVDTARSASVDSGGCVVLLYPVQNDQTAAIVFDEGKAVFAAVADTTTEAQAIAEKAMRKVYPNCHYTGDLA